MARLSLQDDRFETLRLRVDRKSAKVVTEHSCALDIRVGVVLVEGIECAVEVLDHGIAWLGVRVRVQVRVRVIR